jgi:hypothetical protein
MRNVCYLCSNILLLDHEPPIRLRCLSANLASYMRRRSYPECRHFAEVKFSGGRFVAVFNILETICHYPAALE